MKNRNTKEVKHEDFYFAFKCGRICWSRGRGLQLAKEMSIYCTQYCRLWPTDRERLRLADNYDQLLCYDWLASDEAGDLWWGDEAYLAGQASSPQGGGSGRVGWIITGWQRQKDVQERVFRHKSNSLKNWTHLCRTHTEMRWRIPMRLSRVKVSDLEDLCHALFGFFGNGRALYRKRKAKWFPFSGLWPLRKRRMFRRSCAEPSFGRNSRWDWCALLGASSSVVRENKAAYTRYVERKLLSFVDWLLKK